MENNLFSLSLFPIRQTNKQNWPDKYLKKKNLKNNLHVHPQIVWFSFNFFWFKKNVKNFVILNVFFMYI